jgi:hypothetical protein
MSKQGKGDKAAAGPDRTFAPRLGWSLLDSPPGRAVLRSVCNWMVRRLEAERGPPALESRRGIIRLWRIDQYREISLRREETWTLDDGVVLSPDEGVLELHVHGARLFSTLASGLHWRDVIAQEFASLTPLLLGRAESAIVGSTILRRQVVAFGASVREAPKGAHSFLDAFYRRLILLAFHRGGARRVAFEHQPLVEAAISRRDFCARFGERRNAG